MEVRGTMSKRDEGTAVRLSREFSSDPKLRRGRIHRFAVLGIEGCTFRP